MSRGRKSKNDARPAPLPANEAERLDALQRYAILDTGPEDQFDDLTRVAALVCETPIALVSLVDADRQWFKSKVGLDVSETPRDVALCAFAILHGEPFIVPDTLADPRFAENQLVREEPMIRFYAGVPLVTTDGFRLGALCVLDRRPRRLNSIQIETLRSLAHAVAAHLELRRTITTVAAQTAKLREAEANIRSIFDNAVDIIGLAGADGTMRYVSPSLEQIHGYKPEEFIGRTILEYVHPDDRERIVNAFAASFNQHGRAGPLEYRFRNADGSWCWVESYWTCILDGDQTRAIVIDSRDVTKQRAALQALRASEERFRSLSAASPVGIFEADASGKRVYANQRWQQITGLGLEESLGDAWIGAVHPDDRATVLAHWRDEVKSGGEFVDEFRLARRVNGEPGERWGKSRAAPIRDEHGHVLGYVGTLVDVTDLKQAGVAQEKARIAAEEASRAKSEFLASMSHELRTPLTSILGLSEALQQDVYGPLNDQQRRSLKYVEDSGRHLLGLISDLLDLAKIEAGRLDLEMQLFSVEDLCRSCLDLMAQMAEKKGLRLALTIEPQPLLLKSDSRRLKQILFNLLSNAVKFTPAGGAIQLAVCGDRDVGTVALTVADTGVGIAGADLARLFEPFSQLRLQHTPESSGTGLGLAVVKRLTERLGGSVHVESRVGSGSRFTVVVPWTQEDEPRCPASGVAPSPAVKAASHLPPAALGPLILVADDNEVFLHLFSEFFAARGYRIETARDGRETIDRCRSSHPDVILMDIRMPRTNGLEAIRKLRQEADTAVAATPIIALTALVMPGDREQCLAAGANSYVSKPVRLQELLALVEQHVSCNPRS